MTSSSVATLTLTEDQESAKFSFKKFLCSPTDFVWVLSGYSGCGKSTLVERMMAEMDGFMQAVRLINPKAPVYEVALTATTNKAAENLARITGREVKTIHSFLELMLRKDFSTGKSQLVPRNDKVFENYLLFIDEASFFDSQLMKVLFKRTRNCKIIFIGDPAQLIQVGATNAPVFEAGFPGAALTEVVRQAKGNPITDLATKFRHTVNTGEFFSFQPDGHSVVHLNEDDFKAEILKEFGRPDWKFNDSKILGWTNDFAVNANRFVREHVKGDPHFQEGDYATCNSYVQIGKAAIKTDQMVEISKISPDIMVHDVLGNWFTLDGKINAFMPKDRVAKARRVREARHNKELSLALEIEQEWIDLRAVYAQTINKSQGSTYGKVYISLDDVRRCNSGDQIARMLYVGVSRARDNVYLTGDLA